VRLWSWLTGLFRYPGALEKPLNSFVLLLREPRTLDAAALEVVAGKALGVEFGSGNEGAAFVMGESGHLVLLIGDQAFGVNGLPHPYFDQPEHVAGTIRDERACRAVREHTGWLSVDLMGDAVGASLDHAYRIMGHLTAGLAGRDTLAIYAPATGQLRFYDARLDAALRSDDPLEEFTRPLVVPISRVEPGDPRMQEAVEEAGRRWPEFRTAFQRRRRDQSFAVKAPVGLGDHAEWMWIEVTALEGDQIVGTLAHDPRESTTGQAGDPAWVALAELKDWIYTDGERVLGGFTVEASRGLPAGV
jgi:uncharacterized protein YegJ (DUF2314 family)